MLWSLTITSKSEVVYRVPTDVKVSKAVLEPNVREEGAFLVHAKYTDPVTEKVVTVPIAVLRAPVDSTPLELLFDEDEELTFSVTGGDATVHLTGYYVIDDSPYDEISMDDLEDDEEEEVVEQKRKIPLSVPTTVKKQKTESPPKPKQQQQPQKGGAPQKKKGGK